MKPHHSAIVAAHLAAESHRPSIAERQEEARLRLPSMHKTTMVIAALALTVPLFGIARPGPRRESINQAWRKPGRGNVRFVGRPLSQSHQTALFTLAKLRANSCVSNALMFYPSNLLRQMRWSDKSDNIRRLREMLDDMKQAQVHIWRDGQSEERDALRVSFIDTFQPSSEEPWYVRLSEDFLPLFQGHLTYLNMDHRSLAGREGLATYLYGYISAESCEIPFKYSDLRTACGSRSSDLSEFGRECRRVLASFKAQGLIKDFACSNGGFRVLKR